MLDHVFAIDTSTTDGAFNGLMEVFRANASICLGKVAENITV